LLPDTGIHEAMSIADIRETLDTNRERLAELRGFL
jgi:hypothetical protein